MQSDTETLESNTFTSRQKRPEPWQPANNTQYHENVAEGGFTLAANMHDKHTAPTLSHDTEWERVASRGSQSGNQVWLACRASFGAKSAAKATRPVPYIPQTAI